MILNVVQMKQIIVFFLLIIALISCKKDIPEPPTESDSNTSGYISYNEYAITFFNNNFSGGGVLSVSLDGNVQNVTYAYSYNPGCGATGCANFTMPPGTYSYYYQSNSGANLSGSVITGATQCITILID